MNPFELKPKKVDDCVLSWQDIAVKPYKKQEVDPYTKTRIILLNGAEYEGVWFSHRFSRRETNNDIRRGLANVRRQEQQQQKLLSTLKPANESQLETTISYEQLAVDLTSLFAQRTKDKNFKQTLDFALLEDFDHLYRYADLLLNDTGTKAENLVGNYTEIMPGRPTIAHHRNPNDTIKKAILSAKTDLQTILDSHIITAAEQQTMKFYMNLGEFYKHDAGRKLYTEIGMVEEDHVTQYGSLLDQNLTWLECNLMHEYTEAYLYYSMYMDEKDKYLKGLFERLFEMEVAHLFEANKMLNKYEHKSWQDVLRCDGAFPEIVSLHSNKDYVREVLANTVNNTTQKEGYINVANLSDNSRFMQYQNMVNGNNVQNVQSHLVIQNYIDKTGEDYRYQDKTHPVKALQNRQQDNTSVGVRA
ncbi:MAG: hypothetical protein IKV38_01095 [Clostridia bacterium]|nr:hypothetical protein [Clostridia bacterium]